MVQKEKWNKFIELYDYRRSHRIAPTGVPQEQLRNVGISTADVTDWQKQGLVIVLRTINAYIVKPLKR